MSNQLPDSDFLRVSLAELTTPRQGYRCIVNHWWALTDDDEALFYKVRSSPQCNSDRRVVEHIALNIEPKTHAVFVAAAFVPS
jgi:hypothetical protein